MKDEEITIHEMLIEPVYFEKVRAGEKIYEVRTNDDRRKRMHIGDQILLIRNPKDEEEKILFKNEPEKRDMLLLEIVDKIEKDTFTELYDKLDKKAAGFEGKTTKEIVQVLREFYSEEIERENGVVAIEVKLLKDLTLDNKPKTYSKTLNTNNH